MGFCKSQKKFDTDFIQGSRKLFTFKKVGIFWRQKLLMGAISQKQGFLRLRVGKKNKKGQIIKVNIL